MNSEHISAVKAIVESFGEKRFTCKVVKQKLDADHPDLRALSIASVNKIVKKFL